MSLQNIQGTRTFGENPLRFRQLCYAFPLLVLPAFLGLRLIRESSYWMVLREDGPIEYIQALSLVVGAGLAFLTARHLLRLQEKLMAAAFLFLCIGLLLMTGEEISWGQRIFGFVTPPDLAQQNTQKEFNVHNLSSLVFALHSSMIAIGLYTVFGRSIVGIFSKAIIRGPLGLALVEKHVAAIFAPFLLIYCIGQFPRLGLVEWRDLELAEFFMSTGFFAFCISKYLQVRHASRTAN